MSKPILYLNNIKVNAPKHMDWKYAVDERTELVSKLSLPVNYPSLGQLARVIRDADPNNIAFYVLIKEPDYSKPNCGLVDADWKQLNVGVIIGLSSDIKPTFPPGDKGGFFFEEDTGNLYLWDGDAWRLIGGDSSSGFVEYDDVGDLPSTGESLLMYVITGGDVNSCMRWDEADGRYEPLCGGGATVPDTYVALTYQALKDLYLANNFTPGCVYEITNYRAQWYVRDSAGSYSGEIGNPYGFVHTAEPLLVLALTTDILDIRVKSKVYEDHVIEWLPKWDWVEPGAAFEPTGEMILREDIDNDIVIKYDWINIQWTRWVATAPAFDIAATYDRRDPVSYNGGLYVSLFKSNTGNDPV
ncbi:MAG: hypothetical protein KAH32_07490, partial [Chlamydiia bacterium]|nr:hypothetical protein [Chlamydiia bacterium]